MAGVRQARELAELVTRINYQHLLYFWCCVHEGGVQAAARALQLAPATISAQIRKLERRLGVNLLIRSGRGTTPTTTGAQVLAYADQIFGLGEALLESLSPDGSGLRPLRLGIANQVPKLIAYRLLQPLLVDSGHRLIVAEDETERLLVDCGLGALDLVISDTPIPAHQAGRLHNEELGQAALAIYGTPTLMTAWPGDFPARLHGAPWLFPNRNSELARRLERWLAEADVAVQVVGNFENSALLKICGAEGHGFFAAPAAVADHLQSDFGVERAGLADGLSESYYLICADQHLRHPGRLAVLAAGRRLFG